MGEAGDGGSGRKQEGNKLPLDELRGKPGFKIAHLNVRSLTSKVNQLRLDLPRSKLDVMTISETWLTCNIEDRLTTIPGYDFVRTDRDTRLDNGNTKKGGGLGIYYKNTIEADPKKYMNLNESNATLELQWVVLSRPNTKSILIGNVYRPPNGNMVEALNIISEALDQIIELSKLETLIIGDFNADYANKKGQAYKLINNFEAEHQLKQVITSPTRYSNKSHTTIDLAFTNMKHCTSAGVINYNISDHKAIYIIKKKVRNCKATEIHLGRTYANLNIEALTQEYSQLPTAHIFEMEEPNKCWEEIELIINKAADRLCPVKKIRIRKHTNKYLTREILNLQKDRDYFADKADHTEDQGDRFVSKCLARKTQAEVDRARAQYHDSQAVKYNQNHRKYWDNIEEVEPKAQAKIKGLDDEQTGERILDKDLPEAINNFFAGIGAKLAQVFRDIGLEDKVFIPDTNPVIYDIKEINETILEATLREVELDKSSGIKNLNTEFMVMSMRILIKEFTHLFNCAINQGIFPDAWKEATITPIPKIANPKTCGDLRPISILPLPGRILEKFMGKGMTDHLEGTGYLADQQNGFRKNRSTTKSVASLLDKLATAMDEGKIAVTLFLDLKKAFDTVDHAVLMWKLKKAGMGPRLCKLLENYLSGRMQRTKLNNVLSASKKVTTGVPQGSTLGPLLYTVCANDIPSISELIFFTMFADDTTMTVISKDIEKAAEIINSIMPRASTWFEENKLTVNVKKTEYMVFGTKDKLAKAAPIRIWLGGQELRRVESYRYLGTTLDPTLNATNQLGKLNQLIAQKLISFRKIRACISEKSAITIFKATIMPIFDYNDIIYNLLNKQQLVKLQRLQNRALRLIFKGKILSVAEMHTISGVEYLEQRREAHLIALMFNRTKDEEYRDDTQRKTREADAVLLKVPNFKTNKARKAPIYSGSTLWNQLPVRLRQAKDRLHLKKLNKLHRNGLLQNHLVDINGAIVVTDYDH